MAFPILGADWLHHFKMKVDLYGLRLWPRGGGRALHLETPGSGQQYEAVGVIRAYPGDCEFPGSPGAHTRRSSKHVGAVGDGEFPGISGAPTHQVNKAPKCPFKHVLDSFPEVLNESKNLPKPTHGVYHHLETEGRPVTAKYRRLDPERLAAAKQEFADLERQGVVRRSSSNWASPLHMVKKADGTWRPCGDYRRLNVQTKPDLYTCPNIADLTARLEGCCVFTKLDLRKGYHQVPIRREDVAKTAVITPFGLFEYVRMPFGLRNAGQTFQRLMDSVLAGLDFAFCYLDDILIGSSTAEEHVLHLEEVLERLRQHGLVLNGEKCVWGQPTVEYLGHVVSARGLSPLPGRLDAIRAFPRPGTVKQMLTFLGMVNFYRKFMKNAALVLKPLTDALRGASGQKAVQWTAQMEGAFKEAKEMLVKTTCLAHPSKNAQLVLSTDASATHVGAALQQQLPGGALRPLGYFSKKLEPAEQRYAAFDRELLAVYLAIRHFRWALEGRRFYVLTDHKPLTFALHRMGDAWSARVQRQLSYVAEYTSDLRHVVGVENVVADCLSRPPTAISLGGSTKVADVNVPSGSLAATVARDRSAWGLTAAVESSPSVDMAKLAREQRSCVETAALRAKLRTRDVLVGDTTVWCDVSTGRNRLLVPTSMRRAVFDSVHSLAHPGIRASRRMVSSRYVWTGCARDINTWCKECQQCARAKVQPQERAAVEAIPVPVHKLWHVHVDLVGPWPVSSGGHRHLLTVVDRTSRWAEAIPMMSTSAEAVRDAFISNWVARFGVPATVTTDRGVQFTSSTWGEMCQNLGAQHVMTTAYHPQANGMVERFHRQLKEALRARGGGSDWLAHLPWALLGLRSAPKEEAGVSSAEVLFGQPLVLPSQVHQPRDELEEPDQVERIPSTIRVEKEKTLAQEVGVQHADYVMVREGAVVGPLDSKYRGPYKVMLRDKKKLLLEIGASRQ